jgi:hypothetical protein
MTYVSVGEVRRYNAWSPIPVLGDSLARRDGLLYQTTKYPLVDFDFDNVISDDVKVYVGGTPVSFTITDPERGLITLSSAPTGAVTADYYWHPIGDEEIRLAISSAVAEVELLTGFRYVPETVTERIKVFVGNELRTGRPIISVSSVKIYSMAGTLVDDGPRYEVVDAEKGVVRILDYRAGVPTRPYFLPSAYEVEITYQAGYPSTPDYIKNAVVLFATYYILLKFQRMIVLSEDYTQVSLTFKSPAEFTERLEFIRGEVERIRALLPKRSRAID